jgi:hypothetical protein
MYLLHQSAVPARKPFTCAAFCGQELDMKTSTFVRSKRRTFLTALCILALASITIPLRGGTSGAHFFSADATVQSNGNLAITFDEAGLGNGNIDYTATAGALAVYGCINGGSNHPQASNKESVQATASGGGTFQAKNGRVQATIILPVPPPPASFSCPGGQIAVLASVTYTQALLTDSSSGVSIGEADMTGTFSRVFFTFKK